MSNYFNTQQNLYSKEDYINAQKMVQKFSVLKSCTVVWFSRTFQPANLKKKNRGISDTTVSQ